MISTESKPWIVGTLRVVAEAFNVSVQTVNAWRREGMPGEPRSFNLVEVATWRVEHTASRSRGRPTRDRTEEEQDLEAVQLEHARIKKSRDDIKLRKEEGAIVEREIVDVEYASRIVELTTSLEGMAHKMAPILAPAMDPRDVEAALTDEIYRFCEHYSRPLKDELATVEDEEEDRPKRKKRGRPKRK